MTKNASTPAAGIFDAIRPDATTYANHAKNAEGASVRLKDHADIGAVWDRVAYLKGQNAKAVTLTVAREVLGYGKDVTLTRKDGKLSGPDAARLEALKVWIDRNQPKDETPKARVMRVTLSGEGGGSAVVAEDHPLYAALVALVTGADAN